MGWQWCWWPVWRWRCCGLLPPPCCFGTASSFCFLCSLCQQLFFPLYSSFNGGAGGREWLGWRWWSVAVETGDNSCFLFPSAEVLLLLLVSFVLSVNAVLPSLQQLYGGAGAAFSSNGAAPGGMKMMSWGRRWAVLRLWVVLMKTNGSGSRSEAQFFFSLQRCCCFLFSSGAAAGGRSRWARKRRSLAVLVCLYFPPSVSEILSFPSLRSLFSHSTFLIYTSHPHSTFQRPCLRSFSPSSVSKEPSLVPKKNPPLLLVLRAVFIG